MKKSRLILLFVLTFSAKAFSQTTLAEDANGVLNAGKLIIYTGAGQTFFTGHQNGSGYVNAAAIFSALTDNPNGSSNYFYDGQTNGTRAFSIRADGQGYFAGNVGIGTTSPSDALDVKGNPVFGTAIERLSLASVGLAFNRQVATGAIYDNTKFAYQFTHTGSITAGSDYLALQVYNPSGSQVTATALTINGSNQVGVNTNYVSPGYQLGVNGSILATSITVLSRGSWPDYVFQPAYRLPLLSEVKTYVDLNHHLPEIPSEKEIATNGLNLGDLDRVLTKKVEELTLYLIEKDKQLNVQQSQIAEQAATNKQLTEQLKSQQEQITLLIRQVAEISKEKTK